MVWDMPGTFKWPLTNCPEGIRCLSVISFTGGELGTLDSLAKRVHCFDGNEHKTWCCLNIENASDSIDANQLFPFHKVIYKRLVRIRFWTSNCLASHYKISCICSLISRVVLFSLPLLRAPNQGASWHYGLGPLGSFRALWVFMSGPATLVASLFLAAMPGAP